MQLRATDAAERQRLLLSLSRRIEAFLRDEDERGVIGDDAVAEAGTLLELVRNSPGDPEVQMTVAHLHWSRFEIARRSNRPADTERRSALAHFNAVHGRHAEWIPAEARFALERIESDKARASDLIDEAATEQGGTRSLDQAIALIRDIVAELGEEDPTLPIPLSELASALDTRYKVTGRAGDIDEAVEVIDEAIRLTHPVDPEAGRRQQQRKWILVTRYDSGRDQSDLLEAIEVGHTLLDSAAPDDPDRALMLLDFASLYWRRYERTQAVADLDAGIRYGRQGLELIDEHDDGPQAASSKDDLAVLLRHRGDRTGNTADLLEAVRLSRQAVAGFPAGDFDWIGIYSGLGESLRRAGRVMRDADMLREAVHVAEDVARASVERRHPAVAGYRQNAGVSCLALAQVESSRTTLVRAVEHLRAALALAESGVWQDSAAVRSDLGTALAALASLDDDPTLLDEAIAHQADAVGGSPDNPATAQLRINLGAAVRTRYERDRNVEDRARAIGLFRAVAGLEPISTRLRLIGARSWGLLEAEAGNWPDARLALGLAVDLLTQVSGPNLLRDDQERHLMGEPGLVAEAVAAALEVDEVDGAAELFEQGRGVLTAHALDLRTDVGRLAEQHPRLAESFLRLRDSLDGESPDLDSRHLWTGRWHELLREIRDLPGHTDFLRPLTAVQLRAASSAGPIVMVNVAGHRSDALIVQPDRITSLPLPASRSSMEQNALGFVVGREMLFNESLSPTQVDRANDRTREALRWAWQAVTGPVLSHLGLHEPPEPGARRPRMWWMPSTLLNFLPLHAAYDPEGGTSVLDLTISSYTPTVRSLVAARATTTRDVDGAGPLVVAMERTPGLSDLPGVAAEARFIRDEIPGTVSLINEGAAPDVVRESLTRHPWVHFSCHGHSDRTDPSAGYLVLADGARLSLLEISRLRIDGELAFLSACSTGAPGLALVDESVHLAGAFQLAGYQHVIAAMWPILDAIAVRVAQRVYTLIRPGAPSVDHTAAILHDAMLKVRADYPDKPALWAAFVHIGP
jgi:tetratricopeptide (TPR) repeat protein